HDREPVDKSCIGRVFDALPVGLEIVSFEEFGQCAQQRLAVDLFLALAGNEIVDERPITDAALPIERADRQFFLNAKASNAAELDQITAVPALGELGDAAEAADP